MLLGFRNFNIQTQFKARFSPTNSKALKQKTLHLNATLLARLSVFLMSGLGNEILVWGGKLQFFISPYQGRLPSRTEKSYWNERGEPYLAQKWS